MSMPRVELTAIAVVALIAASCGGTSNPPESPSPSAPSAPSAPSSTATGTWLATSGNRIRTSTGAAWMGRGANLQDTRSCNACAYQPPSVAEVKRRIDELADGWKASFIRLTLESYASADGRVHWRGVLDDAAYLQDLREIVDHVGRKPNVYVMLSLWVEPSFNAMGWPTSNTIRVWEKLADTFKNDGHVIFGLVNEPEANFDGSLDGAVWSAMNDTVAAIRRVETTAGTPHRLIAVQGTRQWSRVLDYYLTHPITAGGGVNIAYETHVYDTASFFEARFGGPARSVPVIIGEFGPINEPGVALMTPGDCQELMRQADAAGVPYLGWTFHMRCPPNLLEDTSGGGCGIGSPLVPTAWGVLLRDHLRAMSGR
jgi:endoglucanase